MNSELDPKQAFEETTEQVPSHGGLAQFVRILGKEPLPEHMLDLSQNLNPFLPDRGWLSDWLIALAKEPEIFCNYPDPEYTSLKKAVAAQLDVDLNCINLTNGASEGLMVLFKFLRDQKGATTLALPQPCFSGYERSGEAAGLGLMKLSKARLGGQVTELKDWVELCPNGSILVLGHPNNPDGSIAPDNDIRIAAKSLQLRNSFLVLDEAFIDLVENRRSLARDILSMPNVYAIKSYTKVFGMPGVRFGAIVSPKLDSQNIGRLIPEWNINAITAKLMQHMLEENTTSLSEHSKLISDVRDQLCDMIAGSSNLHVIESCANFILLELGSGLKSSCVQKDLIRFGVLVRDCSNFEASSDRFIRIAVPHPRDLAKLLTALTSAGLLRSSSSNQLHVESLSEVERREKV